MGFAPTSKGHQMANTFGTAYDDWLVGTNGRDVLYGGSGNDYIFGLDNDDFLFGQSGEDIIVGGNGNDFLHGGWDQDELWGGPGRDTFMVGFHSRVYPAYSESWASNLTADRIQDWNPADDLLRMDVTGVDSIPGSPSNYAEAALPYVGNDMEWAVYYAGKYFPDKTYVHLWDPAQKVSFLVADLDHNHRFETGLIFSGVGSAAQLDWSNFI
jgi:hypothetical protein